MCSYLAQNKIKKKPGQGLPQCKIIYTQTLLHAKSPRKQTQRQLQFSLWDFSDKIIIVG